MMIRFRAITGGAAAVLLTAAFAGCGGDDSVSKPGEGFLKDNTTSKSTFKSTNTEQFSKMVDQMKANMKSGHYTQRQLPASKGKGKGEAEAAPKADGGGAENGGQAKP